MTEWLDDFQRVVFTHSLGFPYIRDVRGVCWHRTEGHKAEHAYGVYASFPSCPHLTVDLRPTSTVKAQHVPLTLASYALRNLPGGCELGSTGIIQIELVGFSADSPNLTQPELRWLGEEVLAPVLRACPSIPPYVFKGGRMTCDEWNAWPGGQCGHANCPENDHTDPGDLDLDVILHYALQLLDNEQPKDETMPDYILRYAPDLDHEPWLAVYPSGTVRWVGGNEAGYLVGKAVPFVDEVTVSAYEQAKRDAGVGAAAETP